MCYPRRVDGLRWVEPDIIVDLPGCPGVTASALAGAAAGSWRLMGNRELLGTAALVCTGAACDGADTAAPLIGNKGCGTAPAGRAAL